MSEALSTGGGGGGGVVQESKLHMIIMQNGMSIPLKAPPPIIVVDRFKKFIDTVLADLYNYVQVDE